MIFTSPTTGFVLVSQTVDESPPSAEVERTLDGGRTWQVVWSASRVQLSAIAQAGSDLVAAGITNPTSGTSAQPSPFILTSKDGGGQWTRAATAVPADEIENPTLFGLRLVFATATVGFAVPDLLGAGFRQPPLRTTDGGLHWSHWTLPEGLSADGGMDFVGDGRGFATVSTSNAANSSCEDEIVTTDDNGTTWTPEPSSCVPFELGALSFPTSSDGFASGGVTIQAGDAEQAVLATHDGGQHWSVVYTADRNSDPSVDDPFFALSFTDVTHGYAISGWCDMGANGPCGGTVWATADGGRTWTPTTASGFRLATPAPGDVWVDEDQALLLHSTGGGSTYTPTGQPSAVRVTSLLASGATIFVGSNAGSDLSVDGGRTWRTVTFPGLPTALRPATVPAAIDQNGTVVFAGTTGLWVSHDFGQTGHYVTTGLKAEPDLSIPAVAVSGDNLVAITYGRPFAQEAFSHDGGQHWTVVPARGLNGTNVDNYGGPALSGDNLLEAGNPLGGIFISTDDGQTWTQTGVTPSQDCVANGAADLVGLICDQQISPIHLATPGSPKFTSISFVPAPKGEGYLAIGDSRHLWVAQGPDLWESTDRGHTWHPVLGPWARPGGLG